MGMRIVAFEMKVIVIEVLKVLDLRIEPHLGQRKGGSAELQPRLIKVIPIKVGIS